MMTRAREICAHHHVSLTPDVGADFGPPGYVSVDPMSRSTAVAVTRELLLAAVGYEVSDAPDHDLDQVWLYVRPIEIAVQS